MRFNFNFPVGLCGFHSGWNEKVTNARKIQITYRRLVNLKSLGKISFKSFNKRKQPDSYSYYIKEKSDLNNVNNLVGLSSGAGSAIFFHPTDKCYYRLKRCGYQDKGFTSKKYESSIFQVKSRDLIESNSFDMAGVISMDDAIKECHNLITLKQFGINKTIEAVGIYNLEQIYNLNSSEFFPSALICKIGSDVRIDELIFSTLTPILSRLIEKRVIRFNRLSHEFSTTGFSIAYWRKNGGRDIEDVLWQIGLALGSAYKNLHSVGFLRGIESCWFGNEVIEEDGGIAFVDVASLIDPKQTGKLRNVKEHQYIEYVTAYTNVSFLFQTTNSLLFSFVGSLLAQAFEKGYEKNVIYTLSKKDVFDIIIRHLACRASIYGEL